MSEFVDFLWTVLKSAVNMINGASYWMVLSLIVAGCLHEFLTPEALQKSNLGTTKPTGVLWATLTGMLIPICSCGSIPLGCCFSFLLALFIWAGRGTIQTVKKTEKARGAAAENEVTYADFRYPCPL